MSISSMARLAEGDSAEPDSTLQSAIRLIASYIPAESIAVYIVILGLLAPGPDASSDQVMAIRLVVFVIGLLVSVGLAFVAFKGGTLTRREQQRRQWLVAAMAAVTFAIYAAAMPSFFFQTDILTIPWSQWAAVLAIIAAVVLPTVARSLRLRK
ncbi:MAG: hypothetical protein ABIQ17_07085 [Candidatus Limnocylindrales bacterium]